MRHAANLSVGAGGAVAARYWAAMGSEALELTRRGYEAPNHGDEQWYVDRIGDELVMRFPPGLRG